MNNNSNNSDGTIPEKVLELLPWYAIGNLSVDDQAFFEKALVSYPSLREQLDLEKQMQKAVSEDHSLLDKNALAPTDERLKSVLNLIDAEEAQNNISDANVSNSLFDKAKNLIGSFLPSKDGMPQYTRAASVGVLVLSVAVLTAFVAPLFSDKSDFVPASAVIHPADVQSTPSLINSAKTSLLVGFKGSSIELGDNIVLKGKVLKIESVPDKEGIYQIIFKDAMNAQQIKETIDALNAKEKVWFAGEEY